MYFETGRPLKRPLDGSYGPRDDEPLSISSIARTPARHGATPAKISLSHYQVRSSSYRTPQQPSSQQPAHGGRALHPHPAPRCFSPLKFPAPCTLAQSRHVCAGIIKIQKKRSNCGEEGWAPSTFRVTHHCFCRVCRFGMENK